MSPRRTAQGLLVAMLLATLPCWAAAHRPSAESAAEAASAIPLWPGVAPGSEHVPAVQSIVERSDDPALPDRIITGVTRPYLVVYTPPHPDGSALLVIPGGGYQRVVLDKEGTALVPAFVDRGGVTLFVLRYRLPGEGHDDARDAPLADAQRALRLIRADAAARGLDPHRIGVMGFSAGGHVAASLGTRFDETIYTAIDAADRESARPDFMLLVYPVIDMGERFAHPGSRTRLLGPAPTTADVAAYSLQNRVTAKTPPTFLLHAADDDVVPVENSLAFHASLRRAGIDAALHVFPHGGHGFGTREARGPLAAWPRLALDWMQSVAPEQSQ